METFIIVGACVLVGYGIGAGHILLRIAAHVRAHNYVCVDCGHKLRDAMTGKGHEENVGRPDAS